jgi:Flp pilus assembly protein TadD
MLKPRAMVVGTDGMSRRRIAARGVWAFALVCGLATGTPARAQESYARPVVQPLPPPALDDLNAALADLARDPRNVSALLRAGWASLALDDTQAGLGFFRRASEAAPANGEAKAGMASAMVRLDDPVTAVKLFAEAEAAGLPMERYDGDRGLALDLVGENVAAQRYYKQALAAKNDPEIVRRLALSQAIAGDQRASEAPLLPLLQHRDLAAYRTRAFALAILGKGEEAVSIAETMLPATLSNRMAPYLRYMPRLTRAQQAAAANLGQFPRASEIGRDAPQIAALSADHPVVRAATPVADAGPGARLVPAGEPLGRADRPADDAGRTARRTAAPSPKSEPKTGKNGGEISVSYSALPQPPAVSTAPVRQTPAAVQEAPEPRAPVPQPAPAPAPARQPVAPGPAAATPAVVVASIDARPSSEPSSPPVREVPRPSLSIAEPPPAPAAAAPKERVSLAEAFAEFADADPSRVRPAPGAVDITAIKPARETPKPEVKEEPKAKPKPPAHPSRFWVQVATGRDVKALAYDWRRIKREGGALLAKHDAYTAKWGQTRRLLTGPYKSEDEAQDAVSALKKKGLDSFEFTSDEGEEVTPLG